MKILLVSLLTLSAASVFACIDVGTSDKICTSDKVYPDSYTSHTLGAQVLAINPGSKKITVKSNNSGVIDRFDVSNISIAKGCKSGICTGDKVYPDSYTSHTLGAQVLAINPSSKKITVKSNYSGVIDRFDVSNISIAEGCISGICTGDTVYPDTYTSHTLGAQVLAINPSSKKITVKSNNSGVIDRFDADDLSVIDSCVNFGPVERAYTVFSNSIKH